MEKFKNEKLSEHIVRIIDFTGVCCYLVLGKKRACLLDTCNGIGNIKEYAQSLTSLPIFVILTHGHLDHIGGAGLFDEVYMNHDDLPVYQQHGNMEFRIKDTIAHANMPLDAKSFVPTFEGNIIDIKNDSVFDLGELHIKMHLVKGHTPGMMCPLIVEDRVIIFGDACGVGVLLFDEFSSCVSQYRESLLELKAIEHEYNTIYRNHGTFASPKELLDNVIECCNLILAGKDDHIPSDFHGYQLFAAKATNGHERVDGLQGNIMYALDKAK